MGYAPLKSIKSDISKPLDVLMKETFEKLKREARENPNVIPIIVPKNN